MNGHAASIRGKVERNKDGKNSNILFVVFLLRIETIALLIFLCWFNSPELNLIFDMRKN